MRDRRSTPTTLVLIMMMATNRLCLALQLVCCMLCCHYSVVQGFSVRSLSLGWKQKYNCHTATAYHPPSPLPSIRGSSPLGMKQQRWIRTTRLIRYSTPNGSCDPQKDENTLQSESSTKTTTEVSFPTSPLLLEPFAPAADPQYILQGPVGEGEFVIQRQGGPRAEELTNENLLRIVQLECSDLEVNTLVWKCMGYRFVPAKKSDDDDDDDEDNNNNGSNSYYWSNEEVFPKWRERYPEPPDFIGMRRIYSKEIDQTSLRANQALVRSVPLEKKQSLKTHLMPLGFKGYKYAELTPNKTRRAQCTNWLLYYREELFGYTVEELRERRRLQDDKERQQRESDSQGKEEEEWKPPVQQVF